MAGLVLASRTEKKAEALNQIEDFRLNAYLKKYYRITGENKTVPQTLQIINIIVLLITIGFALYSLSKSDRERKNLKKKKEEDEAEMKQWERGAEIASHDREYLAFVNEITLLGKEYDPHKWYFTMPGSALKHLEACFEGDERKVYLMKRAIELSIEHFAHEMEDDAVCARIIEERVFNNPKPSVPFDREEYMRYRDERIGSEEEFETFEEWKVRMTHEHLNEQDNTKLES